MGLCNNVYTPKPIRKAIILAAGRGTRLGPITCGIGGSGIGISKPLAQVFDKPTIYYPLSDMIAAGIIEILVIASPDNVDQFESLLGDGANLGISISYEVQVEPKGIAEAFSIGKDFIGNDGVALIFGDNVFSGAGFSRQLAEAANNNAGATVFAYHVNDPENFGVVEFDDQGKAVSLEEKPTQPRSDYAVVGVYFYDNSVVEIAENLTPSDRGELEITDVNIEYLKRGGLNVVTLNSDTHWYDTGNARALFDASVHVKEFQERTGDLKGSPELTAFRCGRINREQFSDLVSPTLRKSDYGKKLVDLVC